MAAMNVNYYRHHIHPVTVIANPSPKLSSVFLSLNINRFHSLFQNPSFRFSTKHNSHIAWSAASVSALSASAMASGGLKEVLPPALDSSSDPPAIFDGTTKLYISYTCPYAQRVWIARNYKGLQEKIKLIPINLQNRPAWYKEKVYPPNKVPSLEHNNHVNGESLDLIKYVDSNFEGPLLLPHDPAKIEFAEELLAYTDSFSKAVFSSFKEDGIGEAGDAFNYIEKALSRFHDGPFFLANFSLVDIAYAPFVERFQAVLLDVKNYEITEGRPKLATWIEELNKIEAYTSTKWDIKELVEHYKRRFLSSL